MKRNLLTGMRLTIWFEMSQLRKIGKYPDSFLETKLKTVETQRIQHYYLLSCYSLPDSRKLACCLMRQKMLELCDGDSDSCC